MKTNLKQLFYLKQIIFKIYFGLWFHSSQNRQTFFTDGCKNGEDHGYFSKVSIFVSII